MSLNPGGIVNYNWNYSNQQRDGFSLEICGTVVSLQEVQGREYNPNSNQPGRPACWPDGNPKMNIRMGMALQDGSLKSITFSKAGKKQISGEKPSLHMQLFGLTNGNMDELIGKTVHLWTWPAHPQTGQMWGNGNPRLFGVEELKDVSPFQLASPLPHEFQVPQLYCNDGVQGGQPVAPSPQQMQTPPPMQGQFYAPPTAQPMPQYQPQAYQPQPMQQPAMQPMMQPQPAAPAPAMMQQPPAMQAMPPVQQSAPMPQGMDPAVAQAMQAVGAVNVQPVSDTYSIYDDDIPFA